MGDAGAADALVGYVQSSGRMLASHLAEFV
jgi:hypothetical protein